MLPAGTRLGPYELRSVLGTGAMGEVYEARDTRLDRTVAIKVLPAALAEAPDFRERLGREARAISQLNHPHICTLYDVGDAGGAAVSPGGPVSYLVMELVQGETLAARLARGPLPMPEALTYAAQIADALDKAHRRGIVHGDLKPSNVMIARSGVKLLDFGLATERPASAIQEWADSPTRSVSVGAPGGMFGTLQYLAPEQLEGQPSSEQTDLYACGAVIYEMLTARKAFDGGSQAEVIGAIMRQPAPRLRAALPAAPLTLDRLVATCLAKNPDERWQHAGDLRRELTWIASAEFREAQEARAGGRSVPRSLAAATVLLCGVLAAGAAAWFYVRPAPAPAPVLRASILLPEGLRFPSGGGGGGAGGRLSIAPDGRRVVFAAADTNGNQALWLRPLESSTATPIAGTEGGSSPCWSPDSRSIAFVAQGQLKRVDVDGGTPVTIAAPAISAAGSWGAGDVILFTPTAASPLHRVAASGGAARPVTALDAAEGDVSHRNPFFLPDGRHFLYVAVGAARAGATAPPRSVYLAAIDGSVPARLLIRDASNAQYSQGHLVFLRESMLLGQPFDADRLALSGEPRPLPDQVELVGATGAAFSVAATGTLVYQPAASQGSRLVWFDRQGRQMGAVGEPAQYGDVELSPDGRQAAVSVLDPATNTRDLWVFDLSRGVRSRLTADRADEAAPIWSPDGGRIIFTSNRRGHFDLYERAASAIAPEMPVLVDDAEKYPTSWSSDGRTIIYWTFDAAGTALHMLTLPAGPDRRFLGSPINPGRFAPDRRWVAYFSSESGRPEVYVVPFPNAARKWQVSSAGGSFPRWRADSREIYYISRDNKLMAADVGGEGQDLRVGQAHPLFDARAVGPRFFYDVTPDGQRFLVNMLRDGSAASTMGIVNNWSAALRPE